MRCLQNVMYQNGGSKDMSYNQTRPWYNQGTCQNLKENVYVLFLFIDDNESSWDEKSVKEVWNHEITDA